MRSSWADSAANAEESAPAAAANHGNSRLPRSSYVPPHLRGQAAPAAPAQAGALPSAAATTTTIHASALQLRGAPLLLPEEHASAAAPGDHKPSPRGRALRERRREKPKLPRAERAPPPPPAAAAAASCPSCARSSSSSGEVTLHRSGMTSWRSLHLHSQV